MQRYEKYGSGEQIRRRLAHAQASFDTLNIDMIFNFPHQSEASLAADLDILTGELDAHQVSFYPLMSTKTTRRAMLRELGDVDYGREKSLYRQIVRHMLAAGYERSSAWCFSRQSGMFDEYITEQNDYLGLGSGAFSYIDGTICSATFSINHYLKLIADGKSGIVRQRTTTLKDQMRYHLLMRLFTGAMDLDEADTKFNGDFRRELRPELTGLRLIGATRYNAGRLTLTERGYYLWVIMMREFFTAVNNLRDEMRHNISAESGILRAGT